MSQDQDIIRIVLVAMMLTCCGPEISSAPELDSEETVTAFCEALFSCPEQGAEESYGSLEECEDVHRMNYEERSPSCRDRVLLLEDCLSTLTCRELEDYIEITGSACDDERKELRQAGCTGL